MVTAAASHYREIASSVRTALRACGRAEDACRIVAVSKQQSADRVEAVLAEGHRLFGENRVQEAGARWSDRRAILPDLSLRMIGPLQTNKVREAVALFDAIDTLDRMKLARALADEAQRIGRCPELLVQVNTGEEPQKAGVTPQEADALIAETRALDLPLVGLLCIPPSDEEPAMHFALLAKIAARNGLSELSMGMSGDWETAIRFGATMVRIGSSLFGARDFERVAGTEQL
jgi:pyridoxal phosphate enzyme (YggS family)